MGWTFLLYKIPNARKKTKRDQQPQSLMNVMNSAKTELGFDNVNSIPSKVTRTEIYIHLWQLNMIFPSIIKSA